MNSKELIVANIYLLRHGQVAGDAALYGHTDITVTQQTNNEVASLFQQHCDIANIKLSTIYSSPLTRCLSLAKAIAEKISVPSEAIEIEAGFKEMNFGLYDGIPFDDIHQHPEQWQQLEKFWQNPVQHPLPDAELLTGFAYRVNQAWQQLISELTQQPQDVLLVCHGGVIRMILAHVLNIDYRNPMWYTQLSIAHGSLTSIALNDKGTRVKHIAKPLLSVDAANDGADLNTCLLGVL